MNNNDFDKPMDLNERWTQCPCNGYDILIKKGDYVGAFVHDDMHSPVSRSRCERACACVNALVGVAEPEAAVKAAREAITDARDELAMLGGDASSAYAHGDRMTQSIATKEIAAIHARLDAALALLTPAPSPAAAPAEEKK